MSGHHTGSKQQTDNCSQRGKFNSLSPQSTLPIASRDLLCKCMHTYDNFTISRRPHFIHRFFAPRVSIDRTQLRKLLASLRPKRERERENDITSGHPRSVYKCQRSIFRPSERRSQWSLWSVAMRIRCATLTNMFNSADGDKSAAVNAAAARCC